MLIDNDVYWENLYTQYKDSTIALPIVFDHKVIRDFMYALCCDDCSYCCEKYSTVQLFRRDVRKLKEANIDIEPHMFEEAGHTFFHLYEGCVFLKDKRCSIYAHRPDGCYFAPIQFGANYDNTGKLIDPRLHVRIECKPAVVAIRALLRGALADNPGSILQPDLSIKLGGK